MTTSITVFGKNPKEEDHRPKVTVGVDKTKCIATVYCMDIKTKEFVYESQQPIEKYDSIIEEVKNLFNVISITEEE